MYKLSRDIGSGIVLAFVAIILVCPGRTTRAQDSSSNLGVRIAPVEDIRVIKNDKTDIRVATTFILQCLEKSGASLVWNSEQNSFVLALKNRDRFDNDIAPEKAKEFATTVIPKEYAEVANKSHAWIWVPWEKEPKWMKEAVIQSILFRRDSKGFAFIGLVTTPGSETYILPRIENPTAPLRSEEQNFPFNSSTDIVVMEGRLGALVVKGTMEFLLLGQRMTPYLNYGESAHLVVQTKNTPVPWWILMGRQRKQKPASLSFRSNNGCKLKKLGEKYSELKEAFWSKPKAK